MTKLSSMAFDADERGDVGSRRTPGGKEGEVAATDMAAAQKAALD